MLNNLLNTYKNTIFAKDCIIKEVSMREERKFLNKNCINGYSRSDVCYGLYNKDTLVSLIAIRKYNNNIKVIRLCSSLYTNVIKSYETLLKYIKNKYNPSKVILYANRRFNDIKLYESLGFILKGNTKPDYYYVNDNKRYSKFSHVNKKDANKIYDCGKVIYELADDKEK